MARSRHRRWSLLQIAVALVVAAASGLWALAPAGEVKAQPQPTIVLSPASGPCDGVLEVRGSGFEPRASVGVKLARPHSEGPMGELGSATVDAAGHFSLAVSLGALGCEAAALDTRADDPGEPKDLQIYASYEPRRPRVAAWAVYAYTTTASHAPQALPSTGSGPGPSSGPPGWLALAGVLTGLGLILVVASLYYRRMGS